MKRSNAETVGELSQKILKLFHIDENVMALNIKEDWTKIVTCFCSVYNGLGTIYQLDAGVICQYTQGIRLKDKKLYVTLTSAPLIQELKMNSQLFLSKIWEYYEINADVIKSIHFN
mgnify:CR=1 FL=1